MMKVRNANRLTVTPTSNGLILAMWPSGPGSTFNPLAMREMTHAEAKFLMQQLSEGLRESASA